MSTFCATCGNAMNPDDKFCRICGAQCAPGLTAVAPAPFAAPVPPGKTSVKAILSLVFGLFIFFFPFSIVAIILGHLSFSEIKKSAGRLTGNGLAIAGLVLGYAGIAAIPVILIIAAIAIPNLLRAKMAANESSAVASIRTINTAEISYSTSHSGTGFTCSLSDLAGGQLIDSTLARGQKYGYVFELTACAPGPDGGANGSYHVSAHPAVANQSGVRAFCSDESSVIKVDAGGSAQNCLDHGTPLN